MAQNPIPIRNEWYSKAPYLRACINRSSRVAALVPHFHCEEWLPDCLTSLVQQTHPLDAIIVIDDGSGVPPVDIVSKFPQVTLLASNQNVGPYRLIQQVINDTHFDAYLFQDADDWSTRDRLEVLLAEAEGTGAELIGTQEVRVICDRGELRTFRYMQDANTFMMRHPESYGLLHPSSLVSRDLVMRLGGYATGLRFSGDYEFLLRAIHASVVRNVPRHCYFRRRHSGSLTTDPLTGLQSVERVRLRETLEVRARSRNREAANFRGIALDLAPYAVAGPVDLAHVGGPAISPAMTAPPSESPSASAQASTTTLIHEAIK